MYRYGGLDIVFFCIIVLHSVGTYTMLIQVVHPNKHRTHKATTTYYAATDFSKEKAIGYTTARVRVFHKAVVEGKKE